MVDGGFTRALVPPRRAGRVVEVTEVVVRATVGAATEREGTLGGARCVVETLVGASVRRVRTLRRATLEHSRAALTPTP